MTRPPRMRPVFVLPVPGDGSAVLELLHTKLSSAETELIGQVLPPNAYLRHSDERSRLLSPHLNLDLRSDGGGTRLHGRFSPRPNVWTGFMALFFGLGLLGLAGLIYGLAQMTVGGPIWAMWAAPAAFALIGFIYGAAFIGQGLSVDEMYELRTFVQNTIAEVEAGG